MLMLRSLLPESMNGWKSPFLFSSTAISYSIHCLRSIFEFCSIPSILLPTGLPLPSPRPGRASQHGHHRRRFSSKISRPTKQCWPKEIYGLTMASLFFAQSWMWKGLSFLLPFLCAAYFFQLYNAYVLMRLSFHPECDEWQVWDWLDALAALQDPRTTIYVIWLLY